MVLVGCRDEVESKRRTGEWKLRDRSEPGEGRAAKREMRAQEDSCRLLAYRISWCTSSTASPEAANAPLHLLSATVELELSRAEQNE